MSTFNQYAALYDLIYRDKDYANECKYVIDLLEKHASSPIKSILELGCGTGSYTEIFKREGYHMTGLDISGQMIEIARSKHQNCRFEVSDIRSMKIEADSFDACVSLFHVMSYQSTMDEFGQVLTALKKHLNPGGLFVFDVWHGNGVLTDPPTIRIKRFQNEQMEVLRISEPELNMDENTVDVNFSIFTRNGSEEQFDLIEETHKMRYYFLSEIEMLAKRHQFDLIASHPSYSQETSLKDSWNIHCVLRYEKS